MNLNEDVSLESVELQWVFDPSEGRWWAVSMVLCPRLQDSATVDAGMCCVWRIRVNEHGRFIADETDAYLLSLLSEDTSKALTGEDWNILASIQDLCYSFELILRMKSRTGNVKLIDPSLYRT